MADRFNCPNCGAPLDVHGNDPTTRCPFCNGSVIVPDELRTKSPFFQNTDRINPVPNGNLDDVLKWADIKNEIEDLAKSGNLTEAEKRFQEITGLDQAQAHSAVQALIQGRPINLRETTAFSTRTAFDQSISYERIEPSPITDNRKTKKQSSPLVIFVLSLLGTCLVFMCVLLVNYYDPILANFNALTGAATGIQPDGIVISIPTTSSPQETNTPINIESFAKKDLSFGGEGTGPGLFNDPRAIAVDPSTGNIIVADYMGGRVQVFTDSGKFINQWIVAGKKPIIPSLAAARDGSIYLVSSGKLLVYNQQGELLKTIPPASSSDFYEDIFIQLDSTFLLVSYGENIVHLSKEGKILNRIDQAVSHVTGNAELSSTIAADGSGKIYLLGSFNNFVFVFDSTGGYLSRIGSEGDEPGQFRAPSAIAVDGKGRVFVSDFKGIQEFSNDGRYKNVLNVEGFAFGLIFDDQGRLYLTTNRSKVERYIIQ